MKVEVFPINTTPTEQENSPLVSEGQFPLQSRTPTGNFYVILEITFNLSDSIQVNRDWECLTINTAAWGLGLNAFSKKLLAFGP